MLIYDGIDLTIVAPLRRVSEIQVHQSVSYILSALGIKRRSRQKKSAVILVIITPDITIGPIYIYLC